MPRRSILKVVKVNYTPAAPWMVLRPSEAANLEWSDIHLATLQIEVKARHSKTRRYRLVTIQPNLGEWLMQYRNQDGPVYYSRRKFRAAYKAAGMEEWKRDILRHSYGTYRLPILKSADALAHEMGNSPNVILVAPLVWLRRETLSPCSRNRRRASAASVVLSDLRICLPPRLKSA